MSKLENEWKFLITIKTNEDQEGVIERLKGLLGLCFVSLKLESVFVEEIK